MCPSQKTPSGLLGNILTKLLYYLSVWDCNQKKVFLPGNEKKLVKFI